MQQLQQQNQILISYQILHPSRCLVTFEAFRLVSVIQVAHSKKRCIGRAKLYFGVSITYLLGIEDQGLLIAFDNFEWLAMLNFVGCQEQIQKWPPSNWGRPLYQNVQLFSTRSGAVPSSHQTWWYWCWSRLRSVRLGCLDWRAHRPWTMQLTLPSIISSDWSFGISTGVSLLPYLACFYPY